MEEEEKEDGITHGRPDIEGLVAAFLAESQPSSRIALIGKVVDMV